MERWQLKIAVFIFLVCSVLVVITYMDYLVTGDLTYIGLPIPWDWLKQWWLCTALLFLAISCLVSAAYMLFREETKRHKVTAFILGLTVMWMNLSGLLDLTWFIIDWLKGRLWLTWDTVWVWSPFHWSAGIKWTTTHQMSATAIMVLILGVIWVLYGLYLKRSANQGD